MYFIFYIYKLQYLFEYLLALRTAQQNFPFLMLLTYLPILYTVHTTQACTEQGGRPFAPPPISQGLSFSRVMFLYSFFQDCFDFSKELCTQKKLVRSWKYFLYTRLLYTCTVCFCIKLFSSAESKINVPGVASVTPSTAAGLI